MHGACNTPSHLRTFELPYDGHHLLSLLWIQTYAFSNCVCNNGEALPKLEYETKDDTLMPHLGSTQKQSRGECGLVTVNAEHWIASSTRATRFGPSEQVLD